MTDPSASPVPDPFDRTTFFFDEEPVRTIVLDGEPWLVARDVCHIMGYINCADAVSNHVAPHNRQVIRVQGDTGNLTVPITLINRSGFYTLAMSSQKPDAVRFRDWVADVILPAVERGASPESLGSQSTEKKLDQVLTYNEQISDQNEQMLALLRAIVPAHVREKALIENRGGFLTGQVAPMYGMKVASLHEMMIERGYFKRKYGETSSKRYLLCENRDKKGWFTFEGGIIRWLPEAVEHFRPMASKYIADNPGVALRKRIKTPELPLTRTMFPELEA